jgi:hypothetical protein
MRLHLFILQVSCYAIPIAHPQVQKVALRKQKMFYSYVTVKCLIVPLPDSRAAGRSFYGLTDLLYITVVLGKNKQYVFQTCSRNFPPLLSISLYFELA